MRIAFDASATVKRERTGVGRYAANLLEALLTGYPELDVTLGFRLSRWKRARYRFRSPRGNVRERWFADPFAAALLGDFDVFHGLDAKLPRGVGGPLIATLHDVGAVENEAIAKASFRDKKAAAYADLARRADRIVCVSSAARDAFRALHPLPLDRFAVIHHGVATAFRPQDAAALARVRELHQLPERFVLFVGLISTRKNLSTLIRAFDLVAARDKSVVLALAGGAAHGSEEIEATIAHVAAKDRIRRLGYVRDEDLPALYAAAQVFVFPGLVEGFGMPMIEAMACGTPVLAADRPVTHEVAGDAACIVDAQREAVLAEGLARLLGDPEERALLRRRGFQRAEGFTWGAAARQTLDLYSSVLSVK